MLKRITLIAFAVACMSSTVAAGWMNVGGSAINLPTPKGFCELSPSNKSDKRMLDTVGGLVENGGKGNKVLGFSADCTQLAAWRDGKRQLLDDYFQYQTPLSQMGTSTSVPEPIKTTCDTLRAEGEKIAQRQFPDIKARAESAIARLKLNTVTFMGVLGEDTTACYAAILQKLHTETGTDKTQIIVFATTLIKGKSIFDYRFAVYDGPNTITNVFAKLKLDVAALYAANK